MQSTAGVASGSPRLVAASSAARRSSQRRLVRALQQDRRRGRSRELRIGAAPAAIRRPGARQIRRRLLRGQPVRQAASRASATQPGEPRVTAVPSGGAGPVGEHAAVSQRDAHQQAGGLAAAQRADHHGDGLLRFHVGELPAALLEDAGAPELHGPVLRRVGAVGHVDLDVSVRVGPLELGHLPGERDAVRGVEHRKRMVRLQARRATERQHSQYAPQGQTQLPSHGCGMYHGVAPRENQT